MDPKITYDVILVFGVGPLAVTIVLYAVAAIWAWTILKLNFIVVTYISLSGLLPIAVAFYYYSNEKGYSVFLQLLVGILFVKLFELTAFNLNEFYVERKKRLRK